MKCAEIEKLVYLYDVASPGERMKVDEHAKTCESCQLLLLQQSKYNVMLRQSSIAHGSFDEGAFVDRVMTSLPRGATSNHRAFPFEDIIDSLWLKYSFGFMSVVLAALFLFEYRTPPAHGAVPGDIAANAITLDSKKFLNKRKGHAPVYSLSACITACIDVTATIPCKQCPTFIANK